jgi:hypothetical protein
MVRESDSDPQVQRQNTSSTGEREKEWGGGWSMQRKIPGGLLSCLCCHVPGMHPWNLWQKEGTIPHSSAAGFHNLSPALTGIQHTRINVTDMIPHVFPLRATVEGFLLTARHRDGSLKAVIHPPEYYFGVPLNLVQNYQGSSNRQQVQHGAGRVPRRIPGRNEALAPGHNTCSSPSEKTPGCISNNGNVPSYQLLSPVH